MIYLTGEHALNMECELETCGDWHASALAWKNLTLRESEGSFFGDYGIEKPKRLPYTDLYIDYPPDIHAIADAVCDLRINTYQPFQAVVLYCRSGRIGYIMNKLGESLAKYTLRRDSTCAGLFRPVLPG